MNLFERIFLWTYERATRPYDIIVILILLFIFLVPRGCFEKHPSSEASEASSPAGVKQMPQPSNQDNR